jgi:hypothetical protein
MTSAEAAELRAYYARYPFDDESNFWLTHGMLMAEIRNKFASANSRTASPLDFMPFAKREREEESDMDDEEPIEMLQRNWSRW